VVVPVSFDAAFDHADQSPDRETRFVGVAAVREEPVDLVADNMAALVDAAMVAVGGVAAGLGHACGKVDDILMQNRSVGLQREQIVAAAGAIRSAMSVWVPIASMVPSAPVNCNRSSSSGMVVIANGSFTSILLKNSNFRTDHDLRGH
jgi:hypothetical protein